MTTDQPEPAGAGTAEKTAARAADIVGRWRDHWGIDLRPEVARSLEWRVANAFASAITAAESRAMERCAKIADSYRYGDGNEAVNIAFAIRSSISPPGEEE